MRIVISILMFIVGLGCIAYSYVGTVIRLAEDAARTADSGDEAGAISMVIDFIMRGEVPQLAGYLYAGALLIVLAVVYLLLGKSKDPEDDTAPDKN